MFRALSSVFILAFTASAFALPKVDLVTEAVSKRLSSIGGEFNEAWAGSEKFYLFSGSPMRCKEVASRSLDKAIECQLTGTQLALYPDKGNPFGIFLSKVVLETGTKNRKNLVELVFSGVTERVPGFPDGLEVQFTLSHYDSFPKKQWGTFELPEMEISRLVRAKLR